MSNQLHLVVHKAITVCLPGCFTGKVEMASTFTTEFIADRLI